MTITYDIPTAPPPHWETQLPRFASQWPVGRVGGVMLGEATYFLQRTGPDSLRLVADRALLVEPVKVDPHAALYWQLWSELFLAADGQQRTVLASVEQRLPRQCGCLSAWMAWKAAHPPVFGLGWFEWVWAAKREVRRRQSKDSITLSEARALYSGSREAGNGIYPVVE